METNKLFLFIVISILLHSCGKDQTSPQIQQINELDFEYNTETNPNEIDNELAKFGRLLFYDKDLSLNSNVSCASCHKQQHSFSDNKPLSEGFLNGVTIRNTPPLNNAGFNEWFLWNSRSRGLIQTCIDPIFNPIEMGLTESIFLERITKKELYENLFNNVEDSLELKKEIVGLAISQFISSMIDGNSKFDKFILDQKELTAEENIGRTIFENHCDNCHRLLSSSLNKRKFPFYHWNSFGNRNIGLSFNLEGNGNHGWGFRTPNLRNIEFTGPYMHDGRFETLREVIDHYDTGVNFNQKLAWELIGEDGKPKQLNLSELEKDALEKFLKTLSDESILSDEKFSDPYN